MQEGFAQAAKILKDSEIFEKSKGTEAMGSWKTAFKNSGPAIIQDVTDDATTFSPFPKCVPAHFSDATFLLQHSCSAVASLQSSLAQETHGLVRGRLVVNREGGR